MKRFVLFFAGIVSVLLAVIGIFIPFLPTVPFLILSLFLFSKSSNKFHDLLFYKSIFSKDLQNYKSGLGIKRKVKFFSILFLWISTFVSIFILLKSDSIKILLIIISILISVHIYLIKEFKENEK